MYGNDITIINAGITHVITPTIPLYDHFRIVGTATLVGNVSIALDGSFTPTKWDVICFDWEATVTLGTSTVTIFGTTLTKEQCFGKGFIHCMYNGSSWDVRYYTSITDKATGIGSGATSTALTNGGGTITMDITKNDNTLVLTGSPTLSSSWTVVSGGTPRAGDMQICHYKATATVGANTITILGQLLTTAQALAGNSIVISSYDGSSWRTILLDPAPAAVWELGAGTNSAQTVGTFCDATGLNSVSEGLSSGASGNDSHSEGYATLASGIRSHAQGSLTVASGNSSHAEGYQSESIGHSAHAQGYASIARADYSNAEGKESVAHIVASSAFASAMFTIPGDCQELKLFLKKVTADATPADMLLAFGGTGIEIPTDCIVDFECRYTALQTAGAGGTIGDCVTQKITFSVQNLAGTLTLLTQGIATTATVVTVAGDIVYYESATIGALAATCVPGISGTKVLFVVTGEATKDVQHSCLVSMNINGFGNFSI